MHEFSNTSEAHKQTIDKYVTSCIILSSEVRPRPGLVKIFPAFKQLELSSPSLQNVKVEVIGDPYFIYCNGTYSSYTHIKPLQTNTKLHTVTSKPRLMDNMKQRF